MISVNELKKLSFEEKLTLVEELWDSIAEEGEHLELPDWQKEVLAKRLLAHQADPGSEVSWEEVKQIVEHDNSYGLSPKN